MPNPTWPTNGQIAPGTIYTVPNATGQKVTVVLRRPLDQTVRSLAKHPKHQKSLTPTKVG